MTTSDPVPNWTIIPFAGLILSMALGPILWPRAWEKHRVQALVVALCSAPVLWFFLAHGRAAHMAHAGAEYLAFIVTLGALFITAGGIYVNGDFEATPRTNVLFLLFGSVLASLVGTTGASMLVLRPLLRTNSQRKNTSHLVPFMILSVANAGGLLTPLGDPPLLVGFVDGVPFFWTLKLFPIWLLYVLGSALGLYVVDRRAYRKESPEALRRDQYETRPFELHGRRNVALLLAIVPAALLPSGFRELALLAIAALSYFTTSREAHRLNEFSLAPIVEVALSFAGLFVCLVPIELALSRHAHELPLRASWQLFWVSGLLSAILDNAPTYAALAALGRGLSQGGDQLVAGVDQLMLAAISAGCVVMGATTYIGNAPNLMVKAIAERSGYPLPSFLRFALFAFVAMLPAHLVMTAAFVLMER
jgi:Na+/H+ antiporter NhaD/arsenite permease-like protein